MVAWHGIGSKRRGLEALLDAIEQLQGAAVPASVLERDILPVRVDDYTPAMLDTLMAAGEVVWVGVERLGEKDGRIALYLTDHVTRLRPPVAAPPKLEGRVKAVRDYLASHGASFFAAIREGTGAGLSHRHGGGAVGAGVDGARHQRHAAPAARLHRRRREPAHTTAIAGALPLPPQLAPHVGGPVVAGGHGRRPRRPPPPNGAPPPRISC